MKQLINATTILSLALYIVPPFAAQAQDLQKVMVGDQAVFCLPDKATVCPAGDMCVLAKKAENCQANAEKEVAKVAAEAAAAAGTAAAPATNQAAIDKAAADKAAAEQAAADKAAADQAAATQAATEKAAADKAAAEQAASDKKAARKAAAEQAATEKAATDKTAADKAAADKAAADQATADKAAADKAAATQTATDQAAADKAATEKVAAEKAAAEKKAARKAAAEQAATEKAATDKTAADKAATDKAATDKAAADKAAATQAATDQATADKATADKAAADKATADKAAADQAATAQATTPAPAEAAALKTVTVNGTTVTCLPNKATACPEGAVCVVAVKPGNCKANAEKKVAEMATQTDTTTGTTTPATDPNAAIKVKPKQAAAAKAAADKAAADQAAMDAAAIIAARKAQKAAAAAAANDPNLKPVEAPVPDQKAVKTLKSVLVAPPADATAAAAPVVAAAEAAGKGKGKGLKAPQADDPAPKDAVVTTETVTADSIRTSAQDFGAAPVVVAPGKKTGLSDLEKVGLVALGALVIGAIIDGNRQVVQNTGDRVVVRQPNGSYYVYKDDDTLLREPGVRLTRVTFRDGSTRTVIIRANGTKIVTVRDASGRVLRRVIYDRDERPYVLFDDLRPAPVIIINQLPRPQPQTNIIYLDRDDAAIQATLASVNAATQGQKFSLLQIRTIPQVRDLAPVINVDEITFATGSAAIDPTQAQLLNKLGQFITRMIAGNPGAVFLIGGHTDAVGSAADNLTLSDQRAESVAKALIENFQVPPENLVVQGYGESDLAVNTLGPEPANRRVDVHIITDLLDQTIN